MRYLVVVEKNDSSWGAHVPDLPGCAAVGESRNDVLGLVREAIDLHLRGLREHGQPIPQATCESAFVEASVH